jgi:predicted RNase H-like nuclease (RuvC/YqgF family)
MKNEINRLNKNIESITHLIDSCILHNELKLKETTIEDLKSTHMLMKNRVNHLKRKKEVMKEIENMNNTYTNQIKKLTN